MAVTTEAAFDLGKELLVNGIPEESQELASEDLLPGFRCKLSEIFKTPAHH